MKIWSQSCSAMGKGPIESDYEKSLKRHAQKIARPDTVVDFHGVDAPIPGMTVSHTSTEVCGWQSVRNAIKAEREGYDVFALANTHDPSYYRIREMVDIPVVFMMEVSLHMALMLGQKFAFLTLNPMALLRYAEVARRYDLDAHMVQGGCINVTPPADSEPKFKDFGLNFSQRMFGNPPPYVDIITKAIEEIVARGADIILPLPVPVNMFLIEQGVREVNGAIILDMFGCTIKMAELMVDMKEIGITRSKHGLFAAPPKEVMPALEKLYQITWEVE